MWQTIQTAIASHATFTYPHQRKTVNLHNSIHSNVPFIYNKFSIYRTLGTDAYIVRASSDKEPFWINTYVYTREKNRKYIIYRKFLVFNFNVSCIIRYKCGQCGKDFRQKAILDQHTRTHQVVVFKAILLTHKYIFISLELIKNLKNMQFPIVIREGWSSILLPDAQLQATLCNWTRRKEAHRQPYESAFIKVTPKSNE